MTTDFPQPIVRTSERGAATRAALMAAARDVFTSVGYAQAGVTDVVTRAGAERGQPLPPLHRQGRPVFHAVRGLPPESGAAGPQRGAAGAGPRGDRTQATVPRRRACLPGRMHGGTRTGQAVRERRRPARVRPADAAAAA